MKHTSFPLLSALPLFLILMYSNVCHSRELPTNQEIIEMQQQAQKQFNQDMEAAKNDFDSKYTRMSGTELKKLGKQGDRRALAEVVLRYQQSKREEIGDNNIEILKYAVGEMIKKEAKNQSINLDDSGVEEIFVRLQSHSDTKPKNNIIQQLVTEEVKKYKSTK